MLVSSLSCIQIIYLPVCGDIMPLFDKQTEKSDLLLKV